MRARKRRLPMIAVAVISAIAILTLCIYYVSHSPDYLYRQGVRALDVGNTLSAVSSFSRCIASDSTYTEAFTGRGISYYNQVKLDLAAADLERAIELGASDGETFRLLALIYACWGDTEQGEAILELGRSKVAPEEAQTQLHVVLTPFCLSLAGTAVQDLTELSRWDMIQDLRLTSATELNDYSPIADLPNLVSLELVENGLSNIEFLASLTSLRWLSLAHNQITDIKPLSELKALEYLSLDNNPDLEDLSYLSELTALKSLGIAQTSACDLTPLTELTGLEQLDLSYLTEISISGPVKTGNAVNTVMCYNVPQEAFMGIQKIFPNATFHALGRSGAGTVTHYLPPNEHRTEVNGSIPYELYAADLTEGELAQLLSSEDTYTVRVVFADGSVLERELSIETQANA